MRSSDRILHLLTIPRALSLLPERWHAGRSSCARTGALARVPAEDSRAARVPVTSIATFEPPPARLPRRQRHALATRLVSSCAALGMSGRASALASSLAATEAEHEVEGRLLLDVVVR
eukprot:CAMPEP_0206002998 /NCGR_PEP_ID=MMETSP1464-20131121/3101_1 /ASSEMBLY_ACC=CAM_ASM_001124 /TAXON_ID=119497 /ORGANISM="Exanthemachrysis gayraliae, Strain RCC1523" /LENGTH=117 /DNA_ID=CAMNT_0053376357 /DNA_START=127 /DNA_END=476 /DNA_ORIENTATION=+